MSNGRHLYVNVRFLQIKNLKLCVQIGEERITALTVRSYYNHIKIKISNHITNIQYINVQCVNVIVTTSYKTFGKYVVHDHLKWVVVFDFCIYLSGVQTRDGTTQSARHWSHK